MTKHIIYWLADLSCLLVGAYDPCCTDFTLSVAIREYGARSLSPNKMIASVKKIFVMLESRKLLGSKSFEKRLRRLREESG